MRERSDGDRRARIDRDATGGPALAPGKRTRVPDQVQGRGGRGLPAELRGKLEGDLGADLSGVQVHTGGESADAAEALDARAFTVGQSIHFGAGEYNPESPAGQELIAHEVAHTVQQQGAAGADAGAAGAEQPGMEVSTPDDAHEVEAKQFGREFAAGKQVGAQVKKPVAPSTVSRAMIQREEKAPDAGGGGLFSVDSVVGEVEFNEISLKKFKVGPYIDAEAKFSYGMEAEFQRKPGYTGNAPSESKVNASLVQHVKQLLASAWANADWEKQAKIGTDFKSVTLAPTMVWSSKVGPISVEFTPVEISLIDYSPGKKLKVPKVTVLGLELGVPSHPFEVMGFQTKIAPTGTLAVELTPDYLELGKWAMRKMATMITTDVLLAAGVIVGGVATIAGGLYELSSSGEVTKRTEAAAGSAKSYVSGFLAGAGLPGTNKKPPKDGARFAEGRSAGTTWLGSMLAKYPEGMVREIVDKKAAELRSMAWGSIWPRLEKSAWDSYWADHGWFDREFMGYDTGGPNYNNFRRVLEAIRSNGA